jgi:hypothetical protein
MMKKLALLGLLIAKIRNRRKFKNYYCRVKFALIILFKSKDPSGSYATVAGSKHVGNARFFHFERLGPVTSSRF